jgi:hypothetical protein
VIGAGVALVALAAGLGALPGAEPFDSAAPAAPLRGGRTDAGLAGPPAPLRSGRTDAGLAGPPAPLRSGRAGARLTVGPRAAPPSGRAAGVARRAWDDEQPPGYADEDEPRPHVLVSVWSGEALGGGGSGRSSSFFAGEADWAFEHLDLGVQGAAYRSLTDSTRAWTPVALLRLTQRFRGRRGAELAFGFGLGAGHPSGWTAWYQVTLGVRVPLGPVFLGAELAFEQYDLLRLGGGIGVAF